MTYRDIYVTAVGMAGEELLDDDNIDYAEISPYLLATFCRECASLDRRYRAAHGDSSIPEIPQTARVDLDDAFPLSDVLQPAASYYLCAMLTADENEKLSDKFFDLYTDVLATLAMQLPATAAPAVDRYGLM